MNITRIVAAIALTLTSLAVTPHANAARLPVETCVVTAHDHDMTVVITGHGADKECSRWLEYNRSPVMSRTDVIPPGSVEVCHDQHTAPNTEVWGHPAQDPDAAVVCKGMDAAGDPVAYEGEA